MSKLARCPECGGDVTFAHPASVLSVCSYCRSVLRRMDRESLDLRKLGQVAPVVDLGSRLQLGMRGSAYGGFTVIGHLQLDHGAGTWDEWYLGLDNGKWLWLAEAQRRFYLTAKIGRVIDPPPFVKARLGRTVHLDVSAEEASGSPHKAEELVMRIAEVNTATIVSAQGELPWLFDPGDKLRYADLSGPRQAFATLDYGPPTQPDAQVEAYVGRELNLAELQLDLPIGKELEPPSIKAARLQCPQCQGALELRAPDQARRVTCPYCHALVDCAKEPLKALETLKIEPGEEPRLPLGKKFTLRDHGYTAIGYLRRRTTAGVSWDEYVLLPAPAAPSAPGSAELATGFAYLIDSSGHYTLARPISIAEVEAVAGGRRTQRRYRGLEYRFVEACDPSVVQLVGEFPWAVAIGETVAVEDYAREGSILSEESTTGPDRMELQISLGTYLDPQEVHTALGLTKERDRRRDVAPHQPNPHRAAVGRQGRTVLLFACLMALLMGWSAQRAASRVVVHNFSGQTVPGVTPTPEHTFLSEPFTLGKSSTAPAPLTVELFAPLQNSWLDADIALINDEDGTVHAVSAELSYYSGIDEGEHWSEGRRFTTLTLPAVPPGRYVLRIEPNWPAQQPCDRAVDCGPGPWECQEGSCKRPCESAEECGGELLCVEKKCTPAAVSYEVNLRWGDWRPGWALLLLAIMALVPLTSFLRLSLFEKRRAEDN
jgi:hypothetical protein